MNDYLLKAAARATELYFYNYPLTDALKKVSDEFSKSEVKQCND